MAAIQPKIINGILKWINVGTTVSQIWSCLPSAFRPEVDPNVESDAGEPASPNAPAVPINAAVANGEKPAAIQIGTYRAAIIGIVPNDVPIPIVTIKPTSNNAKAINPFELLPRKFEDTSIKAWTAPVSFKTWLYP